MRGFAVSALRSCGSVSEVVVTGAAALLPRDKPAEKAPRQSSPPPDRKQAGEQGSVRAGTQNCCRVLNGGAIRAVARRTAATTTTGSTELCDDLPDYFVAKREAAGKITKDIAVINPSLEHFRHDFNHACPLPRPEQIGQARADLADNDVGEGE